MEVPIQRSDPAPRGFRYIYLYTCIYSTRFKVYVYMGMGGGGLSPRLMHVAWKPARAVKINPRENLAAARADYAPARVCVYR